jgi:hypothetical protein
MASFRALNFYPDNPDRHREVYPMKTSKLITALALSLALSPAALLAQQETQSEQEVSPPESAAQQEAETAPEPTDSAAAANATLAIMQQRMEEMISHWDKMSQTTDPAERQRLMLEHRQQMMALNTALRNMTQRPGMGGPSQGMMGQGPGMMGGGMGQGMGPGMGNMMGGGMGPGMMGHMMGGMMGQGIDCPTMNKRSGKNRGMVDMMEAFEQLEKRVDLLQQMVEHLMQD